MAKKKPKKGVQTGRNLPSDLPNKYKSYTPAGHLRARQSAAEAPAEPLVVPQRRWKRAVKWSLLVILILILAVVITIFAWDVHNISSAEKKMFGTGNVMSLINSGGLKTDSNGRVNVLIAGDSVDDPGHSGAKLTDSILLISMNPANHTGYMLSIPRDLYVNIPGYGHSKINAAYEDGGMSLLQQVVEQNFGMQISYNFLVSYTAVKNIVNALGGIDITVNSTDGKLFDPNKDWATGGPLVDLTNGRHHLNGEQALDFTRARGDTDALPYGSPEPIGFAQSDYQRTTDQRQVVAAIKAKLNWKLMLDPRKNGVILSAIADNVKTDAPPSAARPLFGLFNSIPNSKMKSYSPREINGKVYLVGELIYGQSVQVPAAGIDNFSQIQAAIEQLNK